MKEKKVLHVMNKWDNDLNLVGIRTLRKYYFNIKGEKALVRGKELGKMFLGTKNKVFKS